MAADQASVSVSARFADSSQSATNVTATLTLRNGVKQEFRERVSEGGAVPRLKDVRESLKAVRSASQDVLNQMVEGERSQQSSNLQKNTTNGEESDYDEEEDNDENSDDDEAMSGINQKLSGCKHVSSKSDEFLSTQPPEKRRKKPEIKGVL